MVIPQFLTKARENAFKSVQKNFRVGAVIANGSRVLSTGRNKPIPHDRREAGLHSIHAEHDSLDRLVDAKHKTTKGATIYVVVINCNSNDVVSACCSSCRKKIMEAGITTMVWSNRGKMVVEKL